MMRTRTDQAYRTVKTIRREGSRIVIRLDCGHTKLHNPRVPTPHKAYCLECDPIVEVER